MEEEKRKGKGERFKKKRKKVEMRTPPAEEQGEKERKKKKNATRRCKSEMKIQQRILLSEEQCAERSSEAYETQTSVQWVRAENDNYFIAKTHKNNINLSQWL